MGLGREVSGGVGEQCAIRLTVSDTLVVLNFASVGVMREMEGRKWGGQI